MRGKHAPRTAALGLLMLLAFTFGALPEEGPSVYSRVLVPEGRDPQAFGDAAAFYSVEQVERLTEDKTVSLLAQLAQKVQAGELPEHTNGTCGKLLLSLEGAAAGSELRGALREVAWVAAGKLTQAGTGGSGAGQANFNQGNAAYEAGSFKQAVSSYGRALCKDPMDLDARNNLALAHVHAGQCAAALFHLEVLARLAPEHPGARINTAVALERLGFSEDAFQAARESAAEARRSPSALYNLAWFENARGAYGDSASTVEAALKLFPEYESAQKLRTLNEIESATSRPPESVLTPSAMDDGNISVKSMKVVVIARHTGLYDGERILGAVSSGTPLMVSEIRGNWVAVYWSRAGIKHRGWLRVRHCSIVVE